MSLDKIKIDGEGFQAEYEHYSMRLTAALNDMADIINKPSDYSLAELSKIADHLVHIVKKVTSVMTIINYIEVTDGRYSMSYYRELFETAFGMETKS